MSFPCFMRRWFGLKPGGIVPASELSPRVTQAEIDRLAKQLVGVCTADLITPESQRLSGQEHANKCLTALMTSYAMLASCAQDPQDVIDDARKFFESPVVRKRMAHFRAKYQGERG